MPSFWTRCSRFSPVKPALKAITVVSARDGKDDGHVDALAAGVNGFLRASVDGANRKVFHVHNIVKGRIECYRIDHGCFLSSTRSLKFMT